MSVRSAVRRGDHTLLVASLACSRLISNEDHAERMNGTDQAVLAHSVVKAPLGPDRPAPSGREERNDSGKLEEEEDGPEVEAAGSLILSSPTGPLPDVDASRSSLTRSRQPAPLHGPTASRLRC